MIKKQLRHALGLLVLLVLSSCVSAEKKAPVLLYPLDKLLSYHRKTGTRIDGERCPFYPSCAVYAQEAIGRHGFLGMWLFIDRLFYRESGLLYRKYLPVRPSISPSLRYYDSLEDTKQAPSFFKENFRKISSF